MESAFAWIGEIIQALGAFIPRRVIIRATHGGVKWKWGKHPREMRPGWRLWWPLTSEIEIIVTARQTLNVPTQALMTKDGRQVVAGGVVIYSVSDVVQAIGERNWDVDSTVNDITQAAIIATVTKWELTNLLTHVGEQVEDALTASCRKQLRQYGVYVHRAALTDFSSCTAFNLLGITTTKSTMPEE